MSVAMEPVHAVSPTALRSSATRDQRACPLLEADATTMTCPLSDAPTRCDLRCAGLDVPARTRQRMAELGMRLGAPIQVLSRTSGRGLVLRVAGARVAVDAATAAGILVRTVSSAAGDRPVPNRA